MFPSPWNLQGGTGGISLQGGTGVQQASPIQVQGTAPTAPQVQGYTTGGTATGGAIASGPSAADIAAQQTAAQVSDLQSQIVARRQQANQIFDALTGAVNALAQAKRSDYETGYNQNVQRAGEDFTQQGDQLNNTYAARGLGDSSYRINAFDQAGQAYTRSLQDMGNTRNTDLANIGSTAASQQAAIGSDRASVNNTPISQIGVRADGSYDVTALQNARDQLDQRIQAATVQQAQLNTPQGYRGQLDQIAPNNQINSQLQSALGGLIKAAIPQNVKDKIASTLISNYAPDQSQLWEQYYQQQQTQQEPTVQNA
jgi:hypothetical protein